jgi:hypothetical protein
MMATAIAPAITSDEALKIARLDAETKYRDLGRFRIEITFQDGAWHVAYHPSARASHGGGPHYIIDALSGEIRWKCYYQ